jgi:hypothetical protein
MMEMYFYIKAIPEMPGHNPDNWSGPVSITDDGIINSWRGW